tara:strand:+ start:848 stop:1003 length:156 start_codon:yes stop_codon:yes gene_type:complete
MKIFKNLVAIFFSKEKNVPTEYRNSSNPNYQADAFVGFVATNIKNNNILDL